MRLAITTDGKLVRKSRESLKSDPIKIAKERMFHALTRAVKVLKKPGKKRKGKVPWDSIKQQRAFFASGGFGGGIPHKRKGAYQKGFKILRISKGHELANKGKSTEFVGGNAKGKRLSRIHTKTHPLIRDVVDKEIKKLPNAVIQHIKVAAKQKR